MRRSSLSTSGSWVSARGRAAHYWWVNRQDLLAEKVAKKVIERPDLSVLSDDDLTELGRIIALARGLAADVPRLCVRRNAALALAMRLDGVDFAALEVSARNVL